MPYRDRFTENGSTTAYAVNVVRTETSAVEATYYHGQHERKDTHDFVDANSYYLLKKCREILPTYVFRVKNVRDTATPGVVNAQLTEYSSLQTYVGQAAQGSFNLATNPNYLPVRPLDLDWLGQVGLESRKKAVEDRFDLMTALAEMRSTVATMGNIVRRFNGKTADIAARAAKYARKARKDPFKVFNDMWLEARYGIRPILYDAAETGRALARLGQGKRAFVIGRDVARYSANASSTLPYASSDINWEYPWTQTWVGEYTVRGWSICTFDSLMSSTFQIDPLVTAWELVPYSFVVDWFVDVGGWASTLIPSATGDLDTYVSYKLDVTYTSALSAVVKPGRGSGEWNYGTRKVEEKSYNRLPGGGDFPDLRPNLSWAKMIDLAALARTGERRVVNTLLDPRRSFLRG